MEEKKFPWLLRLLSINKISIPILDTFVANKERIIGMFCIDNDFHLTQYSSKLTEFKTPYGCLQYIKGLKSFTNPLCSKHCFFLHKGKRTEISQNQMSSYLKCKTGIPLITYIQSSREDFIKFLAFSIEYWKDGYKSSFVPPSSQPMILEKAKELCKYLISIIESHEKRRVVRMQIEFMVSISNKLWLSHMDFCQTVNEERIISSPPSNFSQLSPENSANELLEIINELDSPRNTMQRRPSLIRKLDAFLKISDLIKIDSPDSDFDSELSNISEEESEYAKKNTGSSNKKEEKPKINKNYLELISKTKVNISNPNRKIMITDEEYRNEYKKLTHYFSNSPRATEIKEPLRKRTFDSLSYGKTNGGKTPTGKEKSQSTSTDFLSKFIREKSSSSRAEIYSPILSQRKFKVQLQRDDPLQLFKNNRLLFSGSYSNSSKFFNVLSRLSSPLNEYKVK